MLTVLRCPCALMNLPIGITAQLSMRKTYLHTCSIVLVVLHLVLSHKLRWKNHKNLMVLLRICPTFCFAWSNTVTPWAGMIRSSVNNWQHHC